MWALLFGAATGAAVAGGQNVLVNQVDLSSAINVTFDTTSCPGKSIYDASFGLT